MSLDKGSCGSSGKMLTLVNVLEKKISGDSNIGAVYPFLWLTLMHYWKLKPLQMTKNQSTKGGWGKKAQVRLIFKILTAGK